MTPEELARYDGRQGRKAYVAVNGKVYDVTESPLWVDGNHQNAHQAGSDLTEELKSAPHVRAVMERFPVVGHLEDDPHKPSSGLPVAALLIGVAAVVIVVALLVL